MRCLQLLRKLFGTPNGRACRDPRRQFRRLLVEACDDRRMLATAVDDFYVISANETLTVDGYGAWSNDTYNESWSETSTTCITGEQHPGYTDENGEWHEPWFECFDEEEVTTTNYASGEILTQPANGTLTQIDTGNYYYDDAGNIAGQLGLAFEYTPDPGFAGSDGFRYSITDNDGTQEAWVTITVNPVGNPPVPADDNFTAAEDTRLAISPTDLLANDYDPDGDTLAATVDSQPEHGSLAIDGQGNILYTPYADYNGPDGFTYLATDGNGNFAPAEFPRPSGTATRHRWTPPSPSVLPAC